MHDHLTRVPKGELCNRVTLIENIDRESFKHQPCLLPPRSLQWQLASTTFLTADGAVHST